MASTVRLLQDSPTTQDAFGTHLRLATAIAELITTEKSGKAAAIVGAWGSGKSSVLHMVQARLAGIADVFIFDAWTHEGDPLRRTFLEALIDYLWHDNPANGIKELRDEITLRKKTREETTAPVLTWEASTLGILLLIVPAGLAMFAAMVGMKEPSKTLVIIALILSLCPLIFIIFLGLGVGLRKAVLVACELPRKAGAALALAGALGLAVATFFYHIQVLHFITSLSVLFFIPVIMVVILAIYRSSTSGVLPLLLNRTVTTTRTESFESAEPSSIEFQRWFKSIVEMHHSSSRQLVIAVDNLDRIDPSLARKLWATMRTFFEFASETKLLQDHIWLLVTFDKGVISNLWEVDDPDSFIQKTFQASFYVPSLVLIHRDDYLKKQLSTAFPFIGDVLLDSVTRLYAMKHATEISTPRSIIGFVNSVGSIHRQWQQDEIPLINQAQYVLAAEDTNSTNIRDILTSAATADWSSEALVGPNWQESLAAIHFNVPPKDVAHVFMPPIITSGLMSGDATKFANLAKIRGFGSILSEVVIRNKEAWKQSKNLANAVSALNALRANENDHGINRTWQVFTTAASRIEKWDTLPETGFALSILIRRSSNDNDKISELLNSAGRAIPRTADGSSIDNSEEGLTRFIKALKPVFDLLVALPPSFQMIIYGSAATYINLLNMLSITKPEQFADISCRLDTESRDEIPRVFANLIKDAQLKGGSSTVIKILSAHYIKMDWQPVINAAESLVANTDNNFLQIGFKATFEMLLMLASSDELAVKSLEKLASNGIIYHYLGVVEDPQSKDLAVLMLLFFSDGSEPAAWPGHARQGFSIYHKWVNKPDSASIGVMAQLVVMFGQVARLRLREAHSASMKNDVAAMLKLLAERSEISKWHMKNLSHQEFIPS